MDRKLDGVFFRIERDGKWCNVCLSDMTDEEREHALAKFSNEQLLRTVNILANTIKTIGDAFDICIGGDDD